MISWSTIFNNKYFNNLCRCVQELIKIFEYNYNIQKSMTITSQNYSKPKEINAQASYLLNKLTCKIWSK